MNREKNIKNTVNLLYHSQFIAYFETNVSFLDFFYQ